MPHARLRTHARWIVCVPALAAATQLLSGCNGDLDAYTAGSTTPAVGGRSGAAGSTSSGGNAGTAGIAGTGGRAGAAGTTPAGGRSGGAGTSGGAGAAGVGAAGSGGQGAAGIGGAGQGGGAGAGQAGGGQAGGGQAGQSGQGGQGGQAGGPIGPAECSLTLLDCVKPADGICETDIRTDPRHCGACGNTCVLDARTDSTCEAGLCVLTCKGTARDCDGNPANGCEAQTESDPAHCGSCAQACPSAPRAAAICDKGACGLTCEAGAADCDKDQTNGCETTLRNDPLHCGTCDVACKTGQLCQDGACTDQCAGTVACGASCADLSTDDKHCGACDNACPASERCAAGACVPRCDAPTTFCGGACTDLLTDAKNCGGCGTACAGGRACVAGVCTLQCSPGTTVCDDQCVSLFFDPLHCGACDTVCPTRPNAKAACVISSCETVCKAPFRDCNGNPTDGCEADVTNDKNNCTFCGNACKAGPHATAKCAQTGCEFDACEPDWGDCNKNAVDGCEVDLLTNAANCGACGNVCDANKGLVCEKGACIEDPLRLLQYEVLETRDIRKDGASYIALKVQIRSRTSFTENWCREYQQLCKAFDASPTGCGAPYALQNDGYGICRTEYGSKGAEANLGCNPSGGVYTVASEAGFEGVTTENSFGFHYCEGTCSKEMCEGPNCDSALSYFDASQAYGYTLCQKPDNCPDGQKNCNGDDGDGCEIDVRTSLANCGACGNSCPSSYPSGTSVCADGQCAIGACNEGTADCNGNVNDGCETNTRISSQNCGGCGNVCNTGGGERCVSGKCVAGNPLENQFEVLERRNVTYQGIKYAALKVAFRSDTASKDNWCAEYQALCESQGGLPTGCGNQYTSQNNGYGDCRTKYKSDGVSNTLGCNPSGGVSQAARQAGFSNVSSSNSFGFHSCGGSCTKVFCSGQYCSSALSYISLNDPFGYTLCKLPLRSARSARTKERGGSEARTHRDAPRRWAITARHRASCSLAKPAAGLRRRKAPRVPEDAGP